jgi:hypothetical protein
VGYHVQGIEKSLITKISGSEYNSSLEYCVCSAIVVIGDHKQLPPFSLFKDQGDGFFHRLLRSAGPFPMLTTQYRMESSIAAFVSSTFYGRKLITDPIASRYGCATFALPSQLEQ